MGVNRRGFRHALPETDCPHARGGEPSPTKSVSKTARIVPTPVGVNRQAELLKQYPTYCPHARGGEPAERRIDTTTGGLSPRPWG